MNGPTRLEFRDAPGATRPGLAGRYDAFWKVEVGVPAAAGRADQTVPRVLADAEELDASLASGATARKAAP